MDSVLEVPIPVRFLFLLLGPPTANIDYHQIGRSISTLMSDKVSSADQVTTTRGLQRKTPDPFLLQLFHEAAYQADDRQDLLMAINRFLDCSIVLPPSEVGGDKLLRSVARFQREMLRKREEEQSAKVQEKQSSLQQDEGDVISLA